MPKLCRDAASHVHKNPHNQSLTTNECWSKKQKLNDDLLEEKWILMVEVEQLQVERNWLQVKVIALHEENAKCIEANTDLIELLEDIIDKTLTLSLSLSEMHEKNVELLSSLVEQQDTNATLTSSLESR
jgi:hypothetical protein